MSPERWQRVKVLFEAAVQIPPAERSAFVARECAGDDELRQELESLLESHDENDDFLEEPIEALKNFTEAPLAATAAARAPVQRLGAYEIVKEIGRGGMGSVHLAVRADHEFRKRVAIKLIRHEVENEAAVRRFRNERQILARLEHPNIARLIDGGTTPDGSPYYVMEYVEGEPLQRYCQQQGLPLRERLQIFLKVCSAVEYAHRRMIVHRDLKPGNILVKSDGTPKLLDFGIAKWLEPDTEEEGGHPETTAFGVRVMTPAYASPEQARGEAATVRSDIFSLGVILFELQHGHRPQASDSSATTYAPKPDEPEPEAMLGRRIDDIARQAMRPNPDERFATVDAMAQEIQAALTGAPARRRRSGEEPMDGASCLQSVAILPFQVLQDGAPSESYLGMGITDAVITKLSNVGRISVRPTSAVIRYVPGCDAVAAGRELKVEYVVEGRIQKFESRVRVTVQLVCVDTAAPVRAGTFDEQFEDLLRLEDSISRQIAQDLIPELTGKERARIGRGGTSNPKAHEAYLRGRSAWSRHAPDSLAQALHAYMEAIAEDPEYARAHAGVADCYLQLAVFGGLNPSESLSAAKAAARRSLEIDPALAEAHASLGFALWGLDRDEAAASHEFQLAITLNPNYAEAHCWFALLNSARGRHEQAWASLERARQLDPTDRVFASALALCYYNARRYDQALEIANSALDKMGPSQPLMQMLGWIYLAKGNPVAARDAATRGLALEPRDVFTTAVLAAAETAAGNRPRAVALLNEVLSVGEDRYVSGYALAVLYLAAGRRNDALSSLERAAADRDWWNVWLATSPNWDILRGEDRFLRLESRHVAPAPPTLITTHKLTPSPSTARWQSWAIGMAALLVIAALAVVMFLSRSHKHQPFDEPVIARLTSDGTAMHASFSPDGRYMAYTTNVNGKRILWVRELAGSSAYQVAGPMDEDIRSIEFTRVGTHLSFLRYNEKSPTRSTLYAVPLAGGSLEKVMADVPGPFSVSEDGTRVAFVRANQEHSGDDLFVVGTDGQNLHKVASTQYPDHISSNSNPAWSPDGKFIACAVEGSDKQGFRVALMVFPVTGEGGHTLTVPRWQLISRIAYLPGNRGFLVTAQKQDSSFHQIWLVPPDGVEPRRITNDLSDYFDATVSNDAAALVAVQVQRLSKVSYLRRDKPGQPVEVTANGGRYFDLSVTPDGRILYASDATGLADVWIMNPDGSSQNRLTTGAGRNYSPVASPDGKWIAFHSNRGGNWNIWKMDFQGGQQEQLTTGTHDSNWPQFSPDSESIVYHHTGLNAMFNLWRVPVGGGMSMQLTSRLTMHPAVSSKHGKIVCWFSEDVTNPVWKIAVLPAEGGEPTQLFAVAPTVRPDSELRWTPDGEGITFVGWVNGVANIWIQPLDGTPARQLSQFTWGEIYSFDWSRDGRLYYSQGKSRSDVVLIRDRSAR